MDAISPIGAMVQPPQPINPLQTYAGILGIKQQQQQLQTGQAVQQEAYATAQQEQQTAQQRQNVAQYLQTHDLSKHVDQDGTIDVNYVMQDQGLQQAAGDSWPQVLSSIIKAKQDQITAKQGLASLNNTLRGQFNSTVGSLVNDSDVKEDNEAGRQKVQAAIQAWGQSGGPDAQRIASIYSPQISGVRQGLLQSAIRHIQLQAEDANSQAASQAPSYATVTNGPAIKAYQTNPQGPDAAAVPKTTVLGLGPTDQPEYKAKVAALTTQAAGTAGGITGRIQQAVSAANSSPQALDALSRARAILDRGVWTGTTFNLGRDLRNTLAGVGMDTKAATDDNELVKNLARYEATRANTAGNTDASRALVSLGSPNIHVDNQAAKDVVVQSMANELALQGYTKAVGSQPDLNSQQAAEAKFRSIPNLIQAYEAGLMRNKQEADAFLQRYGLNAKDIAASRKQLRELGAL